MKGSHRFYSGIITDKLRESREFYTENFAFKVAFENEWFILLHLGDFQLGFMQPNHPTQNPIFQTEFGGKGAWFAMEVEDVDGEYQRVKALNLPIALELRDEPWGDRHFAVTDPNGIAVDVVKYSPPSQ